MSKILNQCITVINLQIKNEDNTTLSTKKIMRDANSSSFIVIKGKDVIPDAKLLIKRAKIVLSFRSATKEESEVYRDQEYEKKINTRINQLLKKYPKWKYNIIVLIAKGIVKVGMTKKQVEEALGQPDHISVVKTQFGSQTTYYYDNYEDGYIFYNDKLDTIVNQ